MYCSQTSEDNPYGFCEQPHEIAEESQQKQIPSMWYLWDGVHETLAKQNQRWLVWMANQQTI